MQLRTWYLALALLGLAGASTAQAGLIPAAVNVSSDGANFRFTYAIVLPSDYTLKDGDYFTIYDFKGLVARSNMQPSDWSFDTPNTGVTPSHVAPHDDPGQPNLTWTYHGAGLMGPFGVGKFSADSTLGETGNGDFASRDHRAADGRAVGSITTTTVPLEGPQRAPEPASLALLGLALPFAAAWRWLRRRSQ